MKKTFFLLYYYGKKNFYLAALGSYIIWGFFSLALKPLSAYNSFEILFFRVLFGAVLLVLINVVFRKSILTETFFLFKKLNKSEKIKYLGLTLFGGFLLVINWLVFMYAVNHVSLKSASFAYLICPILTTLFTFLILKEKLNIWQWFAVFLCSISCLILSYGDLNGLIYSLIIAITFALYLISQRKNQFFDKFIVLTFQLIVASLVLMPFYPIYINVIPSDATFYLYLIIIVVVFTITPLFLNLYALKGLSSSTVGILMYTNPLIHYFLALFYFRESINSAQIISYSLILMSILIYNKKYFLTFDRKS